MKHNVTTAEGLLQLKERLLKADIFSFDVECEGPNKAAKLDPFRNELASFAFGVEEDQYYVALKPAHGPFSLLEAMTTLKEVFACDRAVVGHNLKFDIECLVIHNKRLKLEHGFEGINIGWVLRDTMIADWLLDENRKRHGLKPCAKDHLDLNMVGYEKASAGNLFEDSSEKMLEYACEDVRAPLLLWDKYYPALVEQKLWKVFNTLEMEYVWVLADMELAGVMLDVPAADAMIDDLQAQIKAHETEIYKKAGKAFNIGSTQQLSKILFDDLKFKPKDWMKQTASGEWSTAANVLLAFQFDDPLFWEIIEWRGKSHMINSFLLPLKEWAAVNDGRIRSTFLHTGTVSGRLASKDPNMQNIERELLRVLFKAKQGHKFVCADFSQLELRLMAHWSQDPLLMEAYLKGEDVHQRTGDFCGCTRQQGKTVNFGLIYGMSGPTLARQLNTYRLKSRQPPDVTDEKAVEMRNRYFTAYKGVKRFHDRVAMILDKQQYVSTVTGRRRRFPDWLKLKGKRKWAEQRQAINSIIQGCLGGDTRIFARGIGMTCMERQAGKNIELWDGNKYVPVEVVDSGLKDKVIVDFYDGNKIICSPDHCFLTVNEAGHKLWKTPKEFKAVERLLTGNGVEVGFKFEKRWPINPRKTHWKAIKGVANDKQLSFSLIKDDVTLGMLLGRLASDGTISPEKAVGWLVAEHERGLLNKLKKALTPFGKVREWTHKRKGKQNIYWLYVDSAMLARDALLLGVKRGIPWNVLTSYEAISGYLRGLFDGDGGVSGKAITLVFGKHKYKEKWARDVQQALLLFGIRSRVRHYPDDRTVVQVSTKFNLDFIKRIGFLNPSKNRMAVQGQSGLAKYGNIQGNCNRVKRVIFTGEKIRMYDALNSPTSRFMANGLVVHNSAADMVKIAQRNFFKKQSKWGARQILQVHDEILVECPEDKAEIVARELKGIMETCVTLKLPLIADVGHGVTWKEAKA